MHPLLRRFATDFLDVIAPPLCIGCDARLNSGEVGMCMECRISIDAAPYPSVMFDELARRFPRSTLALSAVGSRYVYARDSYTQRLIYALKYQGCYDLGIQMGMITGTAMRVFPDFGAIDVVIPVPLHAAKRRQRGYNQAEAIAEGLAIALQCPVERTALKRVRHTSSQTTLSARERMTNVANAFSVLSTRIEGRTVLLCDDVITTGSTLNTCAQVLREAGAVKVCAVTVAKDELDSRSGE